MITGAAGQIGYALAPMVCRGAMLGPDVPVVLHLLDIPPAETALKGVAMELVDAAYPLLKGIVATTDVAEACKGVDVAVMGKERRGRHTHTRLHTHTPCGTRNNNKHFLCLPTFSFTNRQHFTLPKVKKKLFHAEQATSPPIPPPPPREHQEHHRAHASDVMHVTTRPCIARATM